MKKAYKVELDQDGFPEIVKADITDVNGLSWRDAKKALRDWYLNGAKSLRKITEKEYFGND